MRRGMKSEEGCINGKRQEKLLWTEEENSKI